MSRKVEVYVVKNYWKSATIEVEVPDDVKEDDVHEWLEAKEQKDNHFSDELANGSLQGDGLIEIEINI